MQAAPIGQPFNCSHTLIAHFISKIGTGADGQAIHEYGAAAANLGFAGELHAGEAAAPTKDFGESFAWFDLQGRGFSIQLEGDLHRRSLTG